MTYALTQFETSLEQKWQDFIIQKRNQREKIHKRGEEGRREEKKWRAEKKKANPVSSVWLY